jgi:hypothetical protein
MEHVGQLAIVLAAVAVYTACSGNPGAGTDDPAREPVRSIMTKPPEPIPEHLEHFPGLSIRHGDRIVPAPEADVAVAKRYPTEPAKGAWVDGRRLTILTADARVPAGQPVRIVHVVESTRPGDSLYVMGPKPVFGEYVDGKLVTGPAPATGDPLAPDGDYDGRVLSAPAVDYNYDVTEHALPVGRHIIVWQLGALRSNELVIAVVP